MRARAKTALWLLLGAIAGVLVLGVFVVLNLRGERVVVTLVPGRSVWEAAWAIDQKLPGTGEGVLVRAADEGWVRSLGLPVADRAARLDGVRDTWFEGFLYPETYFFALDASAEDVLQRAAGQFKEVFGQLQVSHEGAFARLEAGLGLHPADVVVLASLVEEETALREEAPSIAGVFLNRLRRGMRLETDPTLMYRPDRVAKVPSPEARRDASNPYNTYVIKGLPPGPICSPGRDALLAVLEAEAHDYLFFVARQDGSRTHAFAATLAEHEANIDTFLRKKRP